MYYYVCNLFGVWRRVSKERYERFVLHIVTGSNAPYAKKVAALEQRTFVSELPLSRSQLVSLAAKKGNA
jgi:hypothetical protein